MKKNRASTTDQTPSAYSQCREGLIRKCFFNFTDSATHSASCMAAKTNGSWLAAMAVAVLTTIALVRTRPIPEQIDAKPPVLRVRTVVVEPQNLTAQIVGYGSGV